MLKMSSFGALTVIVSGKDPILIFAVTTVTWTLALMRRLRLRLRLRHLSPHNGSGNIAYLHLRPSREPMAQLGKKGVKAFFATRPIKHCLILQTRIQIFARF
jgi:hypothetical protein